MPRRDITFEIIRLLSQQIVSDKEKYPEGELIQKTSCMNPDDAELIGILEAIKVFIIDDKETIEMINLTSNFLEKLALSRWIKGELTHLGFRAGLKYRESESLADQQVNYIDETSVKSEEE